MDQITFRIGYKDWLDSNSVRRKSQEVDYGAWWSMDVTINQIRPPFWRVSWIVNTGELYAVDRIHDRFFVLGVFKDRKTVDEAMEGWEESELDHHSDLRWWAEQVRAYIEGMEYEKERTEK